MKKKNSNKEDEIKKKKNAKSSKIVVASSKSGIIAMNSHELCAERRLLNKAKFIMSKKNVPYTLREMKKTLGGSLEINRILANGTQGASQPCKGCSICLCKIDLKLKYHDKQGNSCKVRSIDLNHADKICTLADARRWHKVIPSIAST